MEIETNSSNTWGEFIPLSSAKSNEDFLRATPLSNEAQVSNLCMEKSELILENESLKEKVWELEEEVKKLDSIAKDLVWELLKKELIIQTVIRDTIQERMEMKNLEYELQIYDLNRQIESLSEQKDQFKKICGGINGVSSFYLNQNHTSINEPVCSDYMSNLSEEESQRSDFYCNDKSNQNLLSDLEELLVCPISLERLRNPVMLPSGETIDESTLDRFAEDSKCDPYTRQFLFDCKIVNKLAVMLAEIVEKYKKFSDE